MNEISIRAEDIFHIGNFIVTNSLLLSFLVLLLLVLLAVILHQKISAVPGKMQNIFEIILEEILQLMETVLGSRYLAQKYLPLVATVFLFILTANWLGLLPIVGAVGLRGSESHSSFIPLFRSPASDLNFTLALAIIAVFGVNVLAVLTIGFRRHAAKFFTLANPIFSFVGILELISEFVKIVSFSFRLFGNVLAGEILLTIVGFLVPYFLPLPFLFLEIFVGFIQAFIFSMLTLVFLAMSTAEPSH